MRMPWVMQSRRSVGKIIGHRLSERASVLARRWQGGGRLAPDCGCARGPPPGSGRRAPRAPALRSAGRVAGGSPLQPARRAASVSSSTTSRWSPCCGASRPKRLEKSPFFPLSKSPWVCADPFLRAIFSRPGMREGGLPERALRAPLGRRKEPQGAKKNEGPVAQSGGQFLGQKTCPDSGAKTTPTNASRTVA